MQAFLDQGHAQLFFLPGGYPEKRFIYGSYNGPGATRGLKRPPPKPSTLNSKLELVSAPCSFLLSP